MRWVSLIYCHVCDYHARLQYPTFSTVMCPSRHRSKLWPSDHWSAVATLNICAAIKMHFNHLLGPTGSWPLFNLMQMTGPPFDYSSMLISTVAKPICVDRIINFVQLPPLLTAELSVFL